MGDIIDSGYFCHKCIWVIAYGEKYEETIKYLFDILGINELVMYYAFVDFMNINNEYLNDFSRENLLRFSNYLKRIVPGNDFSAVDRKIADGSSIWIDGFILSQYGIRFMGKISDSIIDPDKKAKSFEFLKLMLYNDMDVLITHSGKYNSKKFMNEKVNEYTEYMLRYIGSINIIIGEYPSLLKDVTFLSRLKCVVERIENSPKDKVKQNIYKSFKEKHGL